MYIYIYIYSDGAEPDSVTSKSLAGSVTVARRTARRSDKVVLSIYRVREVSGKNRLAPASSRQAVGDSSESSWQAAREGPKQRQPRVFPRGYSAAPRRASR